METLAKLFGSASKVKLMRLFLFNPDTFYSNKDIAARAKVTKKELQRELSALIALGMIKKKVVTRDINLKRSKGVAYGLDPKFPYIPALKNLLITVSLHADEMLVKKFASVGKVKFFLAAGVFLQEWNSRVDLLIVGDDLDMARVEKVVALIEAEIGKEISYSAFERTDFEYRLGIHDRLIRDILDAPHMMLIDKLGIKTSL